MSTLLDLTGQNFSGWVVLKRDISPSPRSDARWFCRCICGTLRTVVGIDLRRGVSTSCGCLNRLKTAQRNRDNANPLYATYPKEKKVWESMKQRCTDPKAANFSKYGGKGVKVCKRWNNFANFIKDMGKRPEGWTLERKDNTVGYTPKNCMWAPHWHQIRNRSHAVKVVWGNTEVFLIDVCRRENVSYKCLWRCLKRYGMTIEASVLYAKNGRFTHKEVSKTYPSKIS